MTSLSLFDEYIQLSLLNTFQSMGVLKNKNEKHENEILKKNLRILPIYFQLFNTLLIILKKANFIETVNQQILSTEKVEDKKVVSKIHNLPQYKNQLIIDYPWSKAYFELLDTCLNFYPAILRGEKPAAGILFPNNSTILLENVYRNNPQVDYLNKLTSLIIKKFIESILLNKKNSTIQIVEIGAGTGSTSNEILQNISNFHEYISYFYTDISPYLINHGKNIFQKIYPFIKFKIFNIELPPELQDFEPNSTDIIIGSNVVHATKNLNKTISLLKRLLKTNGILLLNEVVKPLDFLTVTFGLTEGWWLFEDQEIRLKNSPLLTPTQWERTLIHHGFKNIKKLLPLDLGIDTADQLIILAESNGIVKIEPIEEISSNKKHTNLNSDKNSDSSYQIDSLIKSVSSEKVTKEMVINLIKEIFSDAAKVKNKEIDIQKKFESYGIDSLLVVEINRKLKNLFGDLPTTLLFEYTTVESLADYLMESHIEKIGQILNISPDKPSTKLSNVEILTNEPSISKNDIAIIGVSGRYPKAKNIEEYWENLKNSVNCISEIPKQRWEWLNHYNIDKQYQSGIYTKWGGFIDDADKFDPLFFNISPNEAEFIDPQERLFLETVYATLENAGYAGKSLLSIAPKMGVFVGIMNSTYEWLGIEAYQKNKTIAGGTSSWSIANRVSYYFNFHGPSLAINTACSSSLSAIHLACQSLLEGECETAIAGGVNLILHPLHFAKLCSINMLSPDNKCKPFSDAADGFVDGEGVGAILLKPLTKALADGDIIYAVIKSTSVNHGGKTNGYTVPNPNAQAELITSALRKSNIDPRTITYVEAHGTGTSLGDPIEIAGLNKAYSKYTEDKKFCSIGSVKSNIGHLESAAGIAGLTKILLQMKYRKLVPTLHTDILNKNINFSESCFYVQKSLNDWEQPHITQDNQKKQYPLRAAISSFGAGGSNAHIILEEPTETQLQLPYEKPYYLITLSAKTDDTLKRRISDLLNWVEKSNDEAALQNISYTLNCRREHFLKRCAFVVSSKEDLKEILFKLKNNILSIDFITTYIKDYPLDFSKDSLHLIMELKDNQLSESAYQTRLLGLANYYVNGLEINFFELHRGYYEYLIDLPTYPFSKESYWIPNESSTTKHDVTQNNTTDNSLFNNIKDILIKNISSILKIKTDLISLAAPLSELGFDSIHLKILASQLENNFKIKLTPSIFFTYTTPQALIEYLLTLSLPNKLIRPTTYFYKEYNLEPIAIIGMQGYFPQSKNLEEFWQHLQAGHDLVTEIPLERWDWHNYYGDSKQDATKTNSKWGAFIPDFDKFDAAFFNISSREASLMDPQQRLFLEIAWKTFEDAGYDPTALSKQDVGIFVGLEFNDYLSLIRANQKNFHGHLATGNSLALFANRISYFFDLNGPSEVIETACSSSLVAINRAISSLHAGECSTALVGSASLIMEPQTFIITTQLGVLSPDGHCKTFDKSANGYVKGEGVAAVLLKPLSKALQDGDHIYGIIKGSAVNHGGKAQSLTAPNAAAQSQLLIKAYTQAGIDPATITYIETHGTGTELGDPVEIEGLKQAFSSLGVLQQAYCGLGSVKTNIGHLEPVSGIAGVIKVLLAMQHQMIPGNLHFKELNPYIDLNNTPFYIINKNQPWNRLQNDIPRRAGVSSFGFGGTNAHVLIEEAPVVSTPGARTKPCYLISLSAKQDTSLKQKIIDLHVWLKNNSSTISLEDISFTLNNGRTHFEHRCAIVTASTDELLSVLQSIINNQPSDNCVLGIAPSSTNSSPLFNEIYKNAVTAIENYASTSARSYREKLLIIADLYIKNYPIEWNILHKDENHKRLAGLPGYPFNKQRYWFDSELTTTSSIPHSKTNSLQNFTLNYLQAIFGEKLRIPPEQINIDKIYDGMGIDSLLGLEIIKRLEIDFGILPKTLLYDTRQLRKLALFLQENHLATLQKLFVKKDTDASPAQWLIFSDKELGFLLQDELGKSACLYCFSGEKFLQFSPNVFYINPNAVEDYIQLFSNDFLKNLKGIIYLWSLTPKQNNLPSLFQGLSIGHPKNLPQICIVNRNGEIDFINIDLNNLKSNLLIIDLPAKKNLRNEAKIIAQENLTFQPQENYISYKNKHRQASYLSFDSKNQPLATIKKNGKNKPITKSPAIIEDSTCQTIENELILLDESI